MLIPHSLSHVGYAQTQRLAYIDFCLLFRGHLCRNDLIERFKVGLSAGTRDFNLYKELRPNNVIYDTKRKRYFQTASFTPLFRHDAQQTLAKLAHNISDGFDAITDISFPVDAPSQLNVPNIFIVARVIQAILNGRAISMIYTSLSSGSNTREFVPHSVIDNGLRWHVRGYDRRSQSFRDFVLTRFSQVKQLDDSPEPFEHKEEDHQWNRQLDLQIIPHPNNISEPTAIEMDYAMQDGMLQVSTRAALAGYLLRRWNVDCTNDASLTGAEFQLYLRNSQSLMGVENLSIAPGYQPSA